MTSNKAIRDIINLYVTSDYRSRWHDKLMTLRINR